MRQVVVKHWVGAVNLEERLLEELKGLRAGTGLTEARLRTMPALLDNLGGRTTKEALHKLAHLTESISDPEQRLAVQYALGIKGERLAQAEQRRKVTMKELRASKSTVERRERDGLEDLAHIIKEAAGHVVERRDYGASDAERIADLEVIVSTLMRKLYSVSADGLRKQVLTESVNADKDEHDHSAARVIWRSSINGEYAMRLLLEIGAIEEAEARELLAKSEPVKLDLDDDVPEAEELPILDRLD